MQGRSSKPASNGVLRRLAPELSLSSLPLVAVAVLLTGLLPSGASGQDASAVRAAVPSPPSAPAASGPAGRFVLSARH